MVKAVCKLVVAILLLLIPVSNVAAFDIGGVKGRGDGILRGDISKVDWPAGWQQRLEAAQAAIIRKLTTYDSWKFERRVSAKLFYQDPARDYQRREETYFNGTDVLLPVTNKCAMPSLLKTTEVSQFVLEDKSVWVEKGGRDVPGRVEYWANVGGYGWNCEGEEEQVINKNGTDSNYVNDYLKRTRDLKFDFKVYGPEVSTLLVDGGKGYVWNSVLEGRQFIVDNCVCKKKEEEEAQQGTNIFVTFVQSVGKLFSAPKSN